MAHHYLEDIQEPAEETEPVKFNATIVEPFEAAPKPKPPASPVSPCCVKEERLPDLLPVMRHTSDLVDALPTILVGIGCAYAFGFATSALIFSLTAE